MKYLNILTSIRLVKHIEESRNFDKVLMIYDSYDINILHFILRYRALKDAFPQNKTTPTNLLRLPIYHIGAFKIH